jgi:hypothetical protein
LKKSLAGREAKNVFSCGSLPGCRQRPQEQKFFCFFFFKKRSSCFPFSRAGIETTYPLNQRFLLL